MREACAVLAEYAIFEVHGDRYMIGAIVPLFGSEGIRYVETTTVEKSDGTPQNLDRSGIYLASVSYFTSGRVRLLDEQRGVRQLCQLERRAYPTGRIVVQHPSNAHDDVANAICGALVLANGCVDGGAAQWEKIGERADNPFDALFSPFNLVAKA
ncbi:MAG: hypothetical protein ACREJX_18755 [Polyangiaceae bacterium]